MLKKNLPEGWVEKKFSDLFRQVKIFQSAEEELPILSCTKDGIKFQDEHFNKRIASADSSNYQVVPKGHLVLSALNLWLGGIDFQTIVDEGIVSPAYKVFEPIDAETDYTFMRYLIRSEQMMEVYQKVSIQGASIVRRNLNLQELLDHKISLPPLSQQEKIADILGSVDAAMATTRQVIDQTRTLKRTLMQQLLTRGLPGRHTRFKPSPLGDIPEEWEVKPLSKVVDLQTGFPFKSKWFNEAAGLRLLRGENVGYGYPDWEKTCFIDPDEYGQFDDYQMSLHDILIGMDRTFTKSGFKLSRIRESDLPCLLVQRVGRFMKAQCDYEYLHAVLSSELYIRQVLTKQKGSDLPHLSKSEILEPYIPVPSKDEQKAIAGIIQSINMRIAQEEELIAQLEPLKTSLMQGLLTGHIPVNIEQPLEVVA